MFDALDELLEVQPCNVFGQRTGVRQQGEEFAAGCQLQHDEHDGTNLAADDHAVRLLFFLFLFARQIVV